MSEWIDLVEEQGDYLVEVFYEMRGGWAERNRLDGTYDERGDITMEEAWDQFDDFLAHLRKTAL